MPPIKHLTLIAFLLASTTITLIGQITEEQKSIIDLEVQKIQTALRIDKNKAVSVAAIGAEINKQLTNSGLNGDQVISKEVRTRIAELFPAPFVTEALTAQGIIDPTSSTGKNLVSGISASAETPLTTKQRNDIEQKALEDTYGLKFGAGLAFISAINNRDSVKNAAPDASGILRVDYDRAERVAGILETHVIFSGKARAGSTKTRMRHGFFVALEPGEDIARSCGIGYMASFRKFTASSAGVSVPEESVALNIGIGIMADLSRQYLPDSLVADKPIPAGDAVRYEKRTQLNAVLLISAGF